MITIHIETPDFEIVEASDLGMVRGGLTLAKLYDQQVYGFVNPDDWSRSSIIIKKCKITSITTI